MARLGSLCIVAVMFGGCFEGTTPDTTYTKDEARRLGGVSPDGADICAAQGWYGDGVCDAFCVELDEADCAMCPDADDPTVHYVATNPMDCAVISFVCPPGTEPFDGVPADCGCGCEGEITAGCEAMDVDMVGTCEPAPVYWWDGFNCVGESGCSCEGADCDSVYFDAASCEAEHAGCFGDPGPCDAQDARGEGACEAIIGVAWNGTDCEYLSGCSCAGSDCEELYGDYEACIADHTECFECDPAPGDPGVEFVGRSLRECAAIAVACAPGTEYFENDCGCGCEPSDDPVSCEAQDIRAEGPCAAILGVAWNGEACVALSGCSCAGSECDAMYDDMEWCTRDHAECLACDPAPGDPGVEFAAYSIAECSVILIGCDEGMQYFDNACGCGCEPAADCAAQDARAVGGCEPAPFFVWNGSSCVPETGCSCEGTDCDSVYPSEERCSEAHRTCL